MHMCKIGSMQLINLYPLGQSQSYDYQEYLYIVYYSMRMQLLHDTRSYITGYIYLHHLIFPGNIPGLAVTWKIKLT